MTQKTEERYIALFADYCKGLNVKEVAKRNFVKHQSLQEQFNKLRLKYGAAHLTQLAYILFEKGML